MSKAPANFSESTINKIYDFFDNYPLGTPAMYKKKKYPKIALSTFYTYRKKYFANRELVKNINQETPEVKKVVPAYEGTIEKVKALSREELIDQNEFLKWKIKGYQMGWVARLEED